MYIISGKRRPDVATVFCKKGESPDRGCFAGFALRPAPSLSRARLAAAALRSVKGLCCLRASFCCDGSMPSHERLPGLSSVG